MADAVHAISPDILVIVHGGPVAEPDDVQYLLDRTRGVVGFYGASSLERLPVEIAITETTGKFKGLRVPSL
jgi:predicted TIM-barrel enzyme